MRVALTDRFCERAKAADGAAQTDYFDEKVPGLALRVGKGKSWTLHYGPKGSRRRMTFGAYPAISLADARRRALEAKTSVAEGHSPIVAKETLEAVCEEFLRRNPSRSQAQYGKVLARLVYPVLGARPIGDIRRGEIVRLLDGIEDERGPVMADQTLAIIRRIMNYHAAREESFRSPIVKGMRRTKKHERARSRILTDEELQAVWHCQHSLGRLVRFLLLTGARRNEAVEMDPSEINGTEWCLPAARNKAKVDLVRPLSAAALECLPLGCKRGSLSDAKEEFDKASGTKGWTLHDLRRTARSLMSRAGVNSDIGERCLGHVIGGVRGVYDRHEYREEKRLAFEALASLVTRIVNPPAENVVTLRAER